MAPTIAPAVCVRVPPEEPSRSGGLSCAVSFPCCHFHLAGLAGGGGQGCNTSHIKECLRFFQGDAVA